MIAFERRASTVLFNLLRARRDDRPYLVPANACPILAITLLKAGARFHLVDISGTTLAIDPDIVLDRVHRAKDGYAGMIFVRPYGMFADVEDFFREFKRRTAGAIVIDDRCLCMPEFAQFDRTSADAVLYSTGYAKCVDVGWGGYGLVADGVQYRSGVEPFDPEALEQLTSDYKQAVASADKFVYEASQWLDVRVPPVPWTQYVASVKLQRQQALGHKQHLNAIYGARIPAHLCYPDEYQQWRFNLRVGNSAEVLNAVFDAGLFASQHYVPLTRSFGEGRSRNAEEIHRCIINLFNDRHFSEEQAIRVSEIVTKAAIPVPRSRAISGAFDMQA